jgi:hypothetical protein
MRPTAKRSWYLFLLFFVSIAARNYARSVSTSVHVRICVVLSRLDGLGLCRSVKFRTLGTPTVLLG